MSLFTNIEEKEDGELIANAIFAGFALIGIISQPSNGSLSVDGDARRAWMFADAMTKEFMKRADALEEKQNG